MTTGPDRYRVFRVGVPPPSVGWAFLAVGCVGGLVLGAFAANDQGGWSAGLVVSAVATAALVGGVGYLVQRPAVRVTDRGIRTDSYLASKHLAWSTIRRFGHAKRRWWHEGWVELDSGDQVVLQGLQTRWLESAQGETFLNALARLEEYLQEERAS